VLGVRVLTPLLIALVALSTLAPANALAKVGSPEAVPVRAEGNYSRILNHSIYVAKSILTMWGIPSGDEPWALISEAEGLLNDVLSAEGLGNLTEARLKFIEGMGKVKDAISLAANESKRRERLEVEARVRSAMQVVNALNLSAGMLENAINKCLERGVLNESAASELMAELGNAVMKLGELRKYLSNVTEGVAGWDEGYFRGLIKDVEGVLNHVREVLNNASANAVAKKVDARVSSAIRSLEKAISELRKSSEKLRGLGLSKAADELNKTANMLEGKLGEVRSRIEGKLGENPLEVLHYLGIYEDVVNTLRTNVEARWKYVDRGLGLGYNVSKVVEAAEVMLNRTEELVGKAKGLPDDVKEKVLNIVNLYRDALEELKSLVGMVMEGDEGGVNNSVSHIRELVNEARDIVKDLRKELKPGTPLTGLLSPIVSGIDEMINHIANYVAAHAKEVTQVANEVRRGRYTLARQLINRALDAVVSALRLSDVGYCNVSGDVVNALGDVKEDLEKAMERISSNDVSTALEYLNNALNILNSVKDSVGCRYVTHHIELAISSIEQAVDIIQGK